MYSIDSFNVLYNGEVISKLEQPYHKRIENTPLEKMKLVLKQKNNYAIVHYKDTESELHANKDYPSVYLFCDGKLIKTFTANVYHCNPCVEIIRDYFILNEQDGDEDFLRLYNLNGELIRQINYDWEMVRGIHIINDDYFILYLWIWQPFFAASLYHFDTMMKYPFKERTADDYIEIYEGVGIGIPYDEDEFVTITLEEALKLHEKYD